METEQTRQDQKRIEESFLPCNLSWACSVLPGKTEALRDSLARISSDQGENNHG